MISKSPISYIVTLLILLILTACSSGTAIPTATVLPSEIAKTPLKSVK